MSSLNPSPKYSLCGWTYKTFSKHHNVGDICGKKISLDKELCYVHNRIVHSKNDKTQTIDDSKIKTERLQTEKKEKMEDEQKPMLPTKVEKLF